MNRTLFLRRLAGCALLLCVAATCTAGSWDGAKILPKSGRLQLKKSPDDRTCVGDAYKIEWPATVKAVDGQWLQISEAGGYSAAPLEGWVKKDEVVKLEGAHSECTKGIREHKNSSTDKNEKKDVPSLAELYWIRGIYWENKQDIQNAIADYEKSVQECKQPIGDVYLRLGRMLAAHAMTTNDQQTNETAAIFDAADECFYQAESIFQNSKSGFIPPRLYTSWGDALILRYAASKECGCAQRAMRAYQEAEKLNPTWSVPSYCQGMVLLTIVNKAWPETAVAAKQSPDQKLLVSAIQQFSQSIRLDRKAIEPYRDRASALRRLATASGEPSPPAFAVPELCTDSAAGLWPPKLPALSTLSADRRLAILDQADDSADAACQIGNYREPESLEIKARVYAAVASAINPNDPLPVTGIPVEGAAKANVAEAESLFRRAADLADAAAVNSTSWVRVQQRLVLNVEYIDIANRLASYLPGKSRPTLGEMLARVRMTRQKIERNEKQLAEAETANRDNSPEIARLFKNQRDALELAKTTTDHADKEIEKAAGNLTEPRVQLAAQKVSDMDSAFTNLQKATVIARKLAVFRGMLDNAFTIYGESLKELVEEPSVKPVAPNLEAPQPSQSSIPTFAPLFLNPK